MNAIKGYGEMLLEDLDDLGGEALRPEFTTLLAGADNLLSRVDGIVDFSRAEGAEPDREQIETIQITPNSTIIALERAETMERPANFDGRSDENEIGPISPE